MEKKDGCILLRPHHLLCTQGFEGKGYDGRFTANMTEITDRLRRDPDTRVRIVFSTDDICAACPNKIRDGVCRDDDKVLSYDKMVLERFGVGEKDYEYVALIAEIDKMITPEIMDEICGSCRWYAESACRDRVCFSKAQGDSWKQKTGC